MPGACEGYPRASRRGRFRITASAFAVAAGLIGLTLTALPQTAFSAAKSPQSATEASHPHVYLMRGLLNVFSLGMDQLAAQIARNGIDASVYNHSVAETVVGAILQ